MNEDLARRAVACKHWRWMPGMRAIDSDGQAVRVVQASGAAVLEDVGGAAYPMPSTPPDLTDAATLGCLLHLVRSAWHQPLASTYWDQDSLWWSISARCGRELLRNHTEGSGYTTEAEALVTALEFASKLDEEVHHLEENGSKQTENEEDVLRG